MTFTRLLAWLCTSAVLTQTGDDTSFLRLVQLQVAAWTSRQGRVLTSFGMFCLTQLNSLRQTCAYICSVRPATGDMPEALVLNNLPQKPGLVA